MKTRFAVPGVLAGLLSASALFAQTPGNSYQFSAYRPGATYYAEPSAPARLWSQPNSNVSYNRQAEAGLESAAGDEAYLEALEGKSHVPQETAPQDVGPPTIPDLGEPPVSSDSSPSAASCDVSESCSTYGVGQDYFSNACAPCHPWFVYGGGLIMNRDREREVWLSNDSGDYSRQVMGSHDASMDWSGGYEVRLGRHTGCGNWAWELGFWALRDTADFTVTNNDLAGNLDTPLSVNFQGLSYDDGGGLANLDDFFNDAEVHRLQRSFDFYNVELNLFQDPTMFTCDYGCNNLSVGVLGGVRYFRFSEQMTFSTDPTDGVFDGSADEVHYGIDVANNLIGSQIGFIGNLNRGPWNFHLGTKLGLYGNAITHESRVYGANGNAVIDNGLSPNDGREFDVDADKGRVSFLGEIDLGADYQVAERFTITAGYRAVAVTGVALSTDQIPQNFEDLSVVGETQAAGEVILHGAYVGGQYVW